MQFSVLIGGNIRVQIIPKTDIVFLSYIFRLKVLTINRECCNIMVIIEIFWRNYRKMKTQSYGAKDAISMINRLPFIGFTRMRTRKIDPLTILKYLLQIMWKYKYAVAILYGLLQHGMLQMKTMFVSWSMQSRH